MAGENLFNCEMTPNQEAVMATPKVGGNQPTYGLVRNQAEWERVRDELQPPGGIERGVGDLVRITRKVFTSGKIFMHDGQRIDHWGFEDDDGIKDFPSTPIVLSGGDLLQCDMSSSTRQHTIHWHGIEPDPFNDGVGHTSWEITGSYVYQWRAHPANTGTYFYHCHVNTVLHVQMGMFGALLIYPTGTRPEDEWKRPFHDAPADWRFNQEYAWPFYAVDPAWHELNHAAGVCGEDVGLNRFEPQYFTIGRFSQDPNGPPITGDAPTGSAIVDDPEVGDRNRQPIAVEATIGDSVLIRAINATYFPVELDFGQLNSEIRIIEFDGRAPREGIDFTGRGEGVRPVSRPWSSHPRRMAPAERYGLLFQPRLRGTFPVTATYRHWVTNQVVGTVRTTITVS
jgi:FtsP/CotA-like multicopper oxidase with cupredoxin domain